MKAHSAGRSAVLRTGDFAALASGVAHACSRPGSATSIIAEGKRCRYGQYTNHSDRMCGVCDCGAFCFNSASPHAGQVARVLRVGQRPRPGARRICWPTRASRWLGTLPFLRDVSPYSTPAAGAGRCVFAQFAGGCNGFLRARRSRARAWRGDR